MLKKAPAAGENETAMWNSMYPTNVSFFEEYWHKANNIIDPDNEAVDLWKSAGYEEWDCQSESKCLGMKRKSKKHGIVRIEWNNGTEEEATFDLDKYHGLRRRIEGSQVSVELWESDLKVFEMVFN